MKKTIPIPTNIGEYLKYNPETGVLTWHRRISHRAAIGKEAGNINSKGRRTITFDGRTYLAHRIAWFLYYGEDPGIKQVDHINGNPSDNRIDNLRLATNLQNCQNQKAKGFHRVNDKYKAVVMKDGVLHFCGYFDCPLMARLAYEDKKRELCGEFAPF